MAETAPPPASSPAPPPPSSPKPRPWLVYVLIVIVIGLVALSVYLLQQLSPVGGGPSLLASLSNKTQTPQVKEQTTDRDFPPLPTSEITGYAFVEQNDLILIPFDTDNYSPKKLGQINWGSSALGRGGTDPETASDNQKAAYLDTNSHLHAVSLDGENDIVVFDEAQVEYIGGWSPNSQKLLFYVYQPNLENTYFPQGPHPSGSLEQPKTYSTGAKSDGFYLADFLTGKVTHIPPLGEANFITWIDNQTLLMSIDMFDGEIIYLTFDLTSYTADPRLLEGTLENYFGPQVTFSDDGLKWAAALHSVEEGEFTGVRIMVADFPSLDGKTVAEGRFAYMQWPLISPDGQKVIFRVRDDANGPVYAHLFDGQQQSRLFEGVALKWVDNNRFLYFITGPSSATNPHRGRELYLYDLSTGEKVLLHSFELPLQ